MTANVLAISEIITNLTNREYTVIDKEEGLIIIFDRLAWRLGEQRIKEIYKIINATQAEKLDFNKMKKEIIEKVSDKLELKNLLKEVIETSDPADIVEALRRLKQPKIEAKVTAKPHCYGIIIPGNKGQNPLELLIRKNQ